MEIPFNDLSRMSFRIVDELNDAFHSVITRSHYIQDIETKKFEENFASYIGVPYCVGCGNATDALEIIIRALGIGEGDEVLVPANSYVACAESVINAGAVPRFVDISQDYPVIGVKEVEAKLTNAVKAIMVVHLYGYPAKMDHIMELAEKQHLYVIEDCAQAHGATYHGKRVGSFGHAAAFSFYPTKNLGALGDGGAIVTNNHDLAAKCRMLGNHGQKRREDYKMAGRNSRLDEIQAAFLNVKLKYLDEWNNERKTLSNRYQKNLAGSVISFFNEKPSSEPVFHILVAQVEERERLQKHLDKNGIQTMIHYHKTLPELHIFNPYNENDYPTASKISKKIISLPIYPGLKQDEVDYICEKILDKWD